MGGSGGGVTAGGQGGGAQGGGAGGMGGGGGVVTTGLLGQYFRTRDIYATPAITRSDSNVDFNWAGGSPMAGLPTDGFSVRWTGQVVPLYSERYTFYTNADDGTRLWVDGVPLIDNWLNGSVSENSGTILLQAGQRYDLRLEYFENTSTARVHLSWSSARQVKQVVPASQLLPPSRTVGGLAGDYFDGENFNYYFGSRADGPIDFDWTFVGPGGGFPYDTYYSVRWTGEVMPPVSGMYSFYTLSDDGVRLWVNGTLIIDNWTGHSEMQDLGTIPLTAGQRAMIRLDYQQRGGDAVIGLDWSAPGLPREIIPPSALSR
jgi:hypothetical protein